MKPVSRKGVITETLTMTRN